MERPFRSPIEIPELVKDYLKGKTFCEIGCGEGDLLREFAKYADKVYGVEHDSKFFPNLSELWRGDDAYSSEYDLNIGGEAVTPQIDPLDLTQYRLTPESLDKYGRHIQTADQLQKGGSDKSYMNLWGLLK